MKKMRALPLLAVLLVAAFIRVWTSDFKPILLDYDAFYHARIAEEIYQSHHIPTWDSKELGGIPHYYPPGYHIMIMMGKYALPGQSFLEIGSVITVFFGIISTLFVYLLGCKFSNRIGLISALIYAMTPIMVVRSGLWARPTGISLFFTILLVYLFLRIAKERDKRSVILALIVSISYTFTHSSIILPLFLILAVSMISRDNATAKTSIKIALFSLFTAGVYYYRVLPFLNFSISKSGEYLPITRPLELYTSNYLGNLAEVFLYLGLFNLAIFPLILHGIYGMYRQEKQLSILAIFSLFLIFFKANMFMLLNFIVSIAIAVSILRIARIGAPSIAAILLLMVIGMDMLLIQMIEGEKKHPNLDATREILSNAPLNSDNLVLASDPNVGHAIPYFSQAGTFISDLTDTKQFDRNFEVFKKLKDEKTDADDAMSLLKENKIDHLITIGNSSFPFLEDPSGFEIIKQTEIDEFKSSLYKLKK